MKSATSGSRSRCSRWGIPELPAMTGVPILLETVVVLVLTPTWMSFLSSERTRAGS
jgi:hypothetical protein